MQVVFCGSSIASSVHILDDFVYRALLRHRLTESWHISFLPQHRVARISIHCRRLPFGLGYLSVADIEGSGAVDVAAAVVVVLGLVEGCCVYITSDPGVKEVLGDDFQEAIFGRLIVSQISLRWNVAGHRSELQQKSNENTR